VALYVELLERRLGHAAVFCADYLGGAAVGVKWRAATMGQAPLRPETAHLMAPAVPGAGRGGGLLEVRPDVVAILADAAALGAGLVERVEQAAAEGGA